MKLNMERLDSIGTTLRAIRDIEIALEWYEKDLPGPAYIEVGHPQNETWTVSVQFKREQFREFMKERRQQLIQHLEERFEGFEYDPDAPWTGDSDTNE